MRKEISLVKREVFIFALIAASMFLAAMNTLFISNQLLEHVLAVFVNQKVSHSLTKK